MANQFQIVRSFSKLVQNGRTLDSTHDHMLGESIELKEEIQKAQRGETPGTDGIIGEAIDVIACAYDIINQATAHLSDAEVEALCDRLMQTKCEKWARVYG